MVGILGKFGAGGVRDHVYEEHLRWSREERERRYDDEDVYLYGSFHPDHVGVDVSTTSDGDTHLWLHGEVYGFGGRAHRDEPYTPRDAATSSARFCAELYNEYGVEFVHGLNGSFLGFLYEPGERTVLAFTDRLGSVPCFRTRFDDDSIGIATNIQALARMPGVSTGFDRDYLHEYLVFKRSFGVKTPLIGIERLQPGSVTRIDLTGGTAETTSYWEPRYEPVDQSFEYFVGELVAKLQTIFDEWIVDDRSYGLLLSGGSDSRLCLACMSERTPVTAFHMADWMNREARVAERVTHQADETFRWLRREDGYQQQALTRNPRIANFNGWFSHGYPTGFDREISEPVDVLVSGLYADTLFKGHALPKPSVELGPFGRFELPIESSIDSIDAYVDWLVSDVSDELELSSDLRRILRANIRETDDGILHHGIRYDSLDDLIQCGMWYPLSNDDDMLFQASLNQLRPYRTPYLDNRLIDLSLRMPRRYQLRRNIINSALAQIDPGLAAIPNANTGVAPNQSYPIEYVGTLVNAFRRKHFERERAPKDHFNDGSWTDDAELLRVDGFASEVLEAARPSVERLPMLDWDDIMRCYRSHLDGENRIVELYGVLTLLSMPVTAELAEMDGPEPDRVARNEHQRTLVKPVQSKGVGHE